MSSFTFVEVPLVLLRRCTPFLFGALLATACKDPVPTTGTLVVSVTGLPTGANAAVTVTGPNQFFQQVQNTRTLENLVPGTYVIHRDTVTIATTRYGVAVVRDSVTVTRGHTESVAAPYAVASGSLTVTITGLPSGVAALVLVRALPPLNNFQTSFPLSGTIAGLRPGEYEITTDTVVSLQSDKFATLQPRQTVTVPASVTPVEKTVTYFIASGSLALTVTGLPASVTSPPITVSGPGGFQVRTSQSVVFRGLTPGTYSIVATNVAGTCPDMYTTSDSDQSRMVTVGDASPVSVTYTQSQLTPATLNLRIDKVYLTQASQNSAGTVPLISDKTALLRVFGVANQCNTAKPKVRVTLSTGPQFTIDAGEDSVRQSAAEGTLASSWNAVIPASAVQSGMTVVAEMDVASEVAETNENDNRFPASGARAIDVRTAPVVGLRFVPITQAANQLTGNVNASNVNEFMEWPRKLHPVGTYDVDFHDTYTTTVAGGLQASGTNWTTVLSEIRSLQNTEGTLRYYYGVARVNYGGGVAGIAYVPFQSSNTSARAGMGWDDLARAASRVMAHELGHNYGRSHSPCGGPAGIDPEYPNEGAYTGGKIGAFGWDPIEGLKAPDAFTDLMGYCNTQWISDYTYVGILNWLLAAPSSVSTMAAAQAQPSLLIWGRIENGQPVLEPTFEISARPSLPAAGPHRITATDASGAELFAVSFAGERIADLPGEHETFSFTVPVSALRGRTLASLRLTARGKTVSSVASADVAADPAVTVTRLSSRATRLRWDASRFPVVMVRDPVRGQVLSFARGGDVTIATSQTQLDLNFSNRLRSSRRLTALR